MCLSTTEHLASGDCCMEGRGRKGNAARGQVFRYGYRAPLPCLLLAFAAVISLALYTWRTPIAHLAPRQRRAAKRSTTERHGPHLVATGCSTKWMPPPLPSTLLCSCAPPGQEVGMGISCLPRTFYGGALHCCARSMKTARKDAALLLRLRLLPTSPLLYRSTCATPPCRAHTTAAFCADTHRACTPRITRLTPPPHIALSRTPLHGMA